MNDPHLPRDASNQTISPPPEFWLMFASLRRTDIYNAIEKRLGRGLIAQSKVSQFFSEALGDHHWVDEVENLVASLHARMQINAWSIASGEDSVHEGKDGYILITPEDTYGNLCGLFKYNPPGYTSIGFGQFVAILFSFPLFLLLSRKWPLWPWKNEFSDPAGIKSQPPGVEVLVEEEPTLQPAGSAATGSATEVTMAGGAAPEPQGARSVGQEEPTSQPATMATTGLQTEETTTGAVDVAELSGSSGVLLDRAQEPPTPAPAEIFASQRAQTGAVTTDTSADDSADIIWEPLVIGKLIELLVLLLWLWPKKAYEGLSRSNIAIWMERVATG